MSNSPSSNTQIGTLVLCMPSQADYEILVGAQFGTGDVAQQITTENTEHTKKASGLLRDLFALKDTPIQRDLTVYTTSLTTETPVNVHPFPPTFNALCELGLALRQDENTLRHILTDYPKEANPLWFKISAELAKHNQLLAKAR